jgi:hypothetical protein
MGQAKQRGTAEERSQTAREKRREGLQPIDINALRAEHDVPSDAKFVGFVVWLSATNSSCSSTKRRL